MRFIVWLLRAFIFFSLFAFALNNQHVVALNWFFGHAWETRMVFVVLAAFGAGLVLGVLAMAPSWWRQRRLAQRSAAPVAAPAGPAQAPAVPATASVNDLTDARAHGI
ncbi:LapA family protein [Ideonella sp. 4Y16]|uniref:LapA family protein n=1 Tax=Ideonella alba TaxID=2824118 RepID=A0A941BN19_9BURK|nr:LapA family protein [Ideonella alba]MBQ0932854.1 LapA family protein [Ideonella alba]MBQ0945934.1 LapA family protein [Ideonella alba]